MTLTAVLRDGSKFSVGTVTETMAKLEQLHSQDYGNFIALVQHCKHHPNDYPISPIEIGYPGRLDGRRRLRDSLFHHNLLDGDRKVSQTVRTILLNAVESREGSLRLTNPVVRKTDDDADARDTTCLMVALVSLYLVGVGAHFIKRAFE